MSKIDKNVTEERNLKEWLSFNRNKQIIINFEKIRAEVLDCLRKEETDLFVSNSETLSEKNIKIFFSKILQGVTDTDSILKNKYIRIENKIEEYFRYFTLMMEIREQCLPSNIKIGDLFRVQNNEENSRNLHNIKFNQFAQKAVILKYNFMLDIIFTSWFPHYLEKLSGKEYEIYDEIGDYTIVLSPECKKTIMDYKCLHPQDIEDILNGILYFLRKTSDEEHIEGEEKLICHLLKQSLPLWIFLAINLASNEIPRDKNLKSNEEKNEYFKDKNKIMRYICTAYNFLFYKKIENKDFLLEDNILEEARQNFLLYEIADHKVCVLSIKDKGKNKYKKQYEEIIVVSNGREMEEDWEFVVSNEPEKEEHCECYEESIYFDNWIAGLHSEIEDDFYDRRKQLQAVSVFNEILESLKIHRTGVNDCPPINKTLNILMFDVLTGFITLLDKEESSHIQIGLSREGIDMNKIFPSISDEQTEEIQDIVFRLSCNMIKKLNELSQVPSKAYDPIKDYLNRLIKLDEKKDYKVCKPIKGDELGYKIL